VQSTDRAADGRLGDSLELLADSEFAPLGAIARSEQVPAFGRALAGTGVTKMSFWRGERRVASATLGCPRRDVGAIHPEYPDGLRAGHHADLVRARSAVGCQAIRRRLPQPSRVRAIAAGWPVR
jgi:hypothetical protein